MAYSCVSFKGVKTSGARRGAGKGVTLKELADILGLSSTTISLVLNRSKVAQSIPKATKERILEAVRTYNYRPNFLARSLRCQKTYSVGVLVPELSDGYASQVLAGIEQRLLEAGYLCLVATHHHRPDLIEERPMLFYERCVEGIIAVDTPLMEQPPVRTVAVSGHKPLPGVVNIELDHDEAARLALLHLKQLGHEEIAVFKGQSFSSDTEVRWQSIRRAAASMGVEIPEERVSQLEGESPLPDTGYYATLKLLERRARFTALFCFNDISAFGAVRALSSAGLRVPDDVSVVGFDDIWEASYHVPALTTIRQPLVEMGRLAADVMLKHVSAAAGNGQPEVIRVQPQLIVRESTARAAQGRSRG